MKTIKWLLILWHWLLSFFRKETIKEEKHVPNLVKVHKDEDGYYEVHKNKLGYLVSHNKIVVFIAPTLEDAHKWMEEN